MGYKYSVQQHRNQNKFNDEDWTLLESVEFEVVIIDSLNPCYSSIKKMFPSKNYQMGTDTSPLYPEVYNSWNPENHSNPFLSKKGTPECNYFQEIQRFPKKTYQDMNCYLENCWRRSYNIPLIHTPEEQREIQRKKDLTSSPFGKLIEIISRYANMNWICLNAPPNHPIPEEKFLEKYHFLPQTVIRQCPNIYYFQGKRFEGGSIVRPIESVTRYEFENFFGFGLGCGNFNPQKTRYYYSGTMSMDRQNDNSIYSFLEQFGDISKDPEFYRFLVWAAINYMGVLNSNQEDKMTEELARELHMEPMSKDEVKSLMFPIPK